MNEAHHVRGLLYILTTVARMCKKKKWGMGNGKIRELL